MHDRDQTFYEAAVRYEEQLKAGRVTAIHEFVAGYAVELRAELAEYLELGLALGELPPAGTLTAEEQAVAERVAARTRARLQPQPVQTLTDLRKARGLTPAALARQINFPVDLLARVERGGVDPATIPERLVARVAAALQQATDEIRRALSAPQLAPGGVRLSAEQGMQASSETVVSFDEALARSGATPEQRAEWSS